MRNIIKARTDVRPERVDWRKVAECDALPRQEWRHALLKLTLGARG